MLTFHNLVKVGEGHHICFRLKKIDISFSGIASPPKLPKINNFSEGVTIISLTFLLKYGNYFVKHEVNINI